MRQEREVLRGAEILAVLHRELEHMSSDPELPWQKGSFLTAKDPMDEISRHNRELKKVRSFIRGRVSKNEFEYLFLDSFEKMYRLAESVSGENEKFGMFCSLSGKHCEGLSCAWGL